MNKCAIIYYRADAAPGKLIPASAYKANFAYCHGAEYLTRMAGFNEALNAWTVEGVTRVYLDGHADYKYLPQLRSVLRGRGFDVRLCRSDKGTKRPLTIKSFYRSFCAKMGWV